MLINPLTASTHETEPLTHCRRSVPRALNYTDNSLFYQTVSGNITRNDVIDFLEQVAKQGDNRLTFLVLDNARTLHHHIETKREVEWLREHNLFLLYLPT
ncbi:transposase, partial [Xenorhabdus sp. PR6a]|uniref:transposase n=1 Tax=Xenorhabdus sp. PR6a TaxID=3025877 RepID=UPI0023585A7D